MDDSAPNVKQDKRSNLFDRLPDGFFSPLSRKYKAVYAYALITLYHCLKLYKSKITRGVYMDMLRAHGQDIMSLFNIRSDRDDDREDGEDVQVKDPESEDKFAYVVRKLQNCGWFQTEKDYKTGAEYIFLPAFSIKMLELLNDLTSRDSSYIPLVHQTYSELALEDEKEDDFMFRSLANASHNTDQLELAVTLLHHSIVVYNHRLTGVSSPNEALHQHFDDFKTEIGDPIYHPMKTYDSFGLYSRPTVAILRRWLRDERLVSKMANQARSDPSYLGYTQAQATDLVISLLNKVIDVFQRINKSFDDIDRVNSDYTEAVQKKVNYLSGADKSIKGKLEKVVSALAEEMRKHPNADAENSELVRQAEETVSFCRFGILESTSFTMPFRRESRPDEDPLALQDDFALSGGDDLMADFLDREVSQYSEEAIEKFMRAAFAGRKEITTEDIPLNSIDDLILLILGIVRAEFDTSFFTIRKEKESVIHCGYKMPLYTLTRKEK